MTHARSSSPPTLHRRALLSSALGLALGATGCGYLKAEFARTYVLTQELDAYVFQQPFAMVWAKVTDVKGPNDMLMWNGTWLAWEDVDVTHKRTRPKVERSQRGSEVHLTTTVLEVEGATDPRGCRIRYFENRRDVVVRDGKDVGTPSESHDRALVLELELVRMFDPKSAARIEAAAEEGARSGEWYPKKKT